MALATIQELLALVPPPDTPKNATGDWSSVEENLGLSLPTDYKLYLEHYGAGVICSLITIDSPFGLIRTSTGQPMSPRESWLSSVDLYKAWAESGREIPFAVYPDKPGLLPCGSLGDVDVINWYTAGNPDKWHIVYFDRWDGFFEAHGMGLVAFLVALLKGHSPLPNSVIGDSDFRVPFTFKQF